MADNQRLLRIPDGMPVVRYRAPREVEVTGEAPLIDKKDPKQKKIQECLVPHCKVFNLSDADELLAYENVWKAITEGRAKFSEKVGPNWDTTKNAYVAFLRWSDVTFRLPR